MQYLPMDLLRHWDVPHRNNLFMFLAITAAGQQPGVYKWAIAQSNFQNQVESAKTLFVLT